VRYGGNTPCVTVEEGPELLVLDAGSGIRRLGQVLAESGHAGPISLLLSHAHIDHIHGLPFFRPIHNPAARVRIFGPRPEPLPLHETLARLMIPPLWPAAYEPVAQRLNVTEITAEEFETGTFKVRTRTLRHPGRTLGFSISTVAGDKTVNYLTDNELGDWTGAPEWQAGLVGFLRNGSVLIHDATYGDEEIGSKAGWGHSSVSQAVDLALAANVERLVLFHHAPERSDEGIDGLLAGARRRVTASGARLTVDAAAEGLWFDI
jgi:ribonuclease BN (tRNA processing enzyme)